MHGCASNAPKIFKSIDSSKTYSESVSFEVSEREERVLGLQWLTSSNSFVLKSNTSKLLVKLRNCSHVPTKKEFLSVIMSFFDPLGLLSPFTIRVRMLMQKVWESKIDWDDCLREENFQCWRMWLKDFEKVEVCQEPRCYLIREGGGDFFD